jgi:hypothetical protein
MVYELDGRRLGRDALRSRLVSTRSKLRLARLAVDVLRARSVLDDADLSRAAAFDSRSAADYAHSRLNETGGGPICWAASATTGRSTRRSPSPGRRPASRPATSRFPAERIPGSWR